MLRKSCLRTADGGMRKQEKEIPAENALHMDSFFIIDCKKNDAGFFYEGVHRRTGALYCRLHY